MKTYFHLGGRSDEDEADLVDSSDETEEYYSDDEVEAVWQTRCEDDDITAEFPRFSLCGFCEHEVLEDAVVKLANERESPLPMSQCVGPTLEVQVRDCKIQLVAKVIVLVLLFWRASLEDTYQRGGLMAISGFAWLALAYKHIRAETFCFRHTTIPYSQVIGNWKILDMNCGFTVFVVWGSVVSALQFVGMATSTLFTANNIFHPFDDSNDIHLHAGDVSEAAAWCVTLKQSFIPVSIRTHWKDVAVGVAWMATLMPEIYSMLRYWPKAGQKVLSKVEAKPFTDNQQSNYELWFMGETTSVGAAAYDLAEGAGMGTIRLQTPLFPEYKADAIWKRIENNDGNGKSLEQSMVQALQHITGVMPRAIRRILLEALARNLGQSNVQVTLFAMKRLHDHGDWSSELNFATMSIVVSLLPALQAIIFGLQVLKIVVVTWFRVNKHLGDVDEADEDTQKVRNEFWRLKMWTCRLCVVLFLHVLATAYTLAKFNGAYWACPYYLWNLKASSSCVDLGSDFNATKTCTLE